jgi:hypothetical protein
MLKKIILFSIIISLSSCKTKTAVTAPIKTTAEIGSTTAFYTKIKAQPNFQTLKITSRIDVQNGNFIPPLDATIYIEKDQKVWMNMVAIFLNVGRGMATPTGIKGYEKLNKTYIESDFSYLNNLLKVNFIDFSSLQNLLIGKTFIPIDQKDFSLTKNAQGYSLNSLKNLKFENNGKSAEYKFSMLYSNDFDLMEVKLIDQNKTNELEISYLNWVSFEEMKLPKNVKINIKGSKTSEIFLENTRFESSKIETPYSVPNNYTKTEIR